jgi:hypothetical protein
VEIEEKLLNYTKVKGSLPTECWEWQGARYDYGYGRVHWNGEWRAHRASYTVHVGAIPRGLYVLHRCDNPPCLNPDHLFLGTQAENIVDMVRKGRCNAASGSRAGLAVLTDELAAELLQLLSEGKSEVFIAEYYGLSRSVVRSLAIGESYRDIPGDRREKRRPVSQFCGVTAKRDKWRARIRAFGREIVLGYFKTEIEAAIAYNNAVAYYGLKRPLNVIEQADERR